MLFTRPFPMEGSINLWDLSDMRSGQNCLQYCLVIFISPAASIAVYSFNISQAFALHLCQYAKGVSEVELLSLPTHHCYHLVENGVGLQCQISITALVMVYGMARVFLSYVYVDVLYVV